MRDKDYDRIEKLGEQMPKTLDLYHWSLNYDCGKGPFVAFMDLIGWSYDELGENLFDWGSIPERLGYIELSKLGLALGEYSDDPNDVKEFVGIILEAEREE